MQGEGRQVSYAYFKAFNQMLNNLNLLEEAVAMATEAAAPHTAVTLEQVQAAARKYPQVLSGVLCLWCACGVLCLWCACGVCLVFAHVFVCCYQRQTAVSVCVVLGVQIVFINR